MQFYIRYGKRNINLIIVKYWYWLLLDARATKYLNIKKISQDLFWGPLLVYQYIAIPYPVKCRAVSRYMSLSLSLFHKFVPSFSFFPRSFLSSVRWHIITSQGIVLPIYANSMRSSKKYDWKKYWLGKGGTFILLLVIPMYWKPKLSK